MRTRSYEFYEVRTNLTANDPNVHCRGALESCRTKLRNMEQYVDEQGNVYLVRVTLIEALKSDKH